MSITIDPSQLPALVRITVIRSFPSPNEQLAFRRELESTVGFTSATAALIDLTRMTDVPSFSAIQSRGDDWLLRRAYLVDLGTIGYGVARQARTLAKPPTLIGVFHDEAKAVAWLLSGATSQDE